MLEMERRKQKLCELQIKRREEQELRRIELEIQQSHAREALRSVCTLYTVGIYPINLG